MPETLKIPPRPSDSPDWARMLAPLSPAQRRQFAAWRAQLEQVATDLVGVTNRDMHRATLRKFAARIHGLLRAIPDVADPDPDPEKQEESTS
jgi:hypothetical protein